MERIPYFALIKVQKDINETSKPIPRMSETIIRDTDIPHDDNLPEQTRHIVIPSYAAWFDYNRYFQKIQQKYIH